MPKRCSASGWVDRPTIFGRFHPSLDRQTFTDWLRGVYPMTVKTTTPDDVIYLLAVDAAATAALRSERWSVTYR
jgi:hypothetical protein